jgi:hypothetical protein
MTSEWEFTENQRRELQPYISRPTGTQAGSTLLSMPITNQARQQEWNTICTIARNNDFPLRTVHNLRKRITKTQKTDSNSTSARPNKIWVTFTYHNPLVHKLTNLFKHTNINTAFRTSNTIYIWLQDKIPQNKINCSGIYKLQCTTRNTYTKWYPKFPRICL